MASLEVRADDKVGEGDKTTSKNVQTTEKTSEDDPELIALLDSALEDLDNQPKHPQPSIQRTNLSNEQSSSEPVAPGNPVPELSQQQEAIFNELFGGEESEDGAKEFEETMRRFMQQDPQLLSHFEQVTKMANDPGTTEEDGGAELAATLAQTLSGMAQNAESLKKDMSEEDLMKAFGGMGMGGGGEGAEGDFMPMMQGMMKNLLSKEILYPSLKEISEKYPKWLTDNKESTESSEFEKYDKQHKLMKHICTQFESESDTDSETVQNERFEKILDLMQQMQELGQPPKEIVGEMAPGLDFDENGLPKLPSGQQCCVM